jgi:carboxypeptidase Taq
METLLILPTTRGDGHRRVEADMIELKRRLLEISDCEAAVDLLHWDQATYMPPGGAAARAHQLSTLSRIAHEKSVDPELGKLLERLITYGESLAYGSDEASLIRVARRNFDKAIKVPADYVARASDLASASYDAWTRARPENDFPAMIPFLQQALDLSREYAGFFSPYENIADPLIDDADEGMTTAAVRDLFVDLRRELVPIVRAITDQPAADDSCLKGAFDAAKQLEFSRAVVRSIGYDFARGRLDTTHHPFCTGSSIGDVRITTRVYEHDIGQALFSSLHEAGHALYEQGVASKLEGTPLAHGTSAGVHESQSRLWENLIGRNRGFWEFFYPKLREIFPDHFESVSLDAFYSAINKVEPTLIRADADEVTYDLHVMMRFDFEVDLLEGRLEIKELPEAWNARMQLDLGITPSDDRNGCLQDVHWFVNGIGGSFQSYTIGNVLAAQFYAAAIQANPRIPCEVSSGDFGALQNWLRDNIYRHGSKFTPGELIKRVTGDHASTSPYLNYLRKKYGELHRLPQ